MIAKDFKNGEHSKTEENSPKLKDEIFPCDEGEKNGGDVFFPIPSAFLFVCIHIFNLFQIGELANGLSLEFMKEYNKIPWKQIIGMRNKIVHGYDTINFEIVWRTAIESIPELKSYCEEILN